jgi:hypothetical protein
MKSILHRDGTVTYWAVYLQSWERRVPLLPTRELAAMAKSDRNRILRHLEKAWDRLHPGEEP